MHYNDKNRLWSFIRSWITYLFVVVMITAPITVYSQRANVWYFGDFAGLEFGNDTVVGSTRNNVMSSNNGCAIMCDANGELILFSNGEKVWNAYNRVIPDGDNLNGDNEATQNSLFVPAPGNGNQFYLFTQDRTPPVGPNGLCYSIVEITNSEIQILEKNTAVFPLSSEKLTAVLHANGTDYWIICRAYNSDEWNAFLLTEDGITDEPVISATGTVQTSNSMTDLPVGFLKANPEGTLLATALYDKDVFEIYDFDKSTGVLSNPRTSRQQYDGAYGVEFSPDGSKLYGSTYYMTGGSNASYLFQFNLLSGTDLNSVSVVPSYSDYPYRATAMQLGPDGRIYVARSDADSIGVIITPDRVGQDCNFVESYIGLQSRECKSGLPNVLSHYLTSTMIQSDHKCLGDTTWFSLSNYAFIDSLRWDFIDEEGIPGRFDTSLKPYHIFSTVDTFRINLAIYYQGREHKYESQVTIYPNPEPDLGEDFSLYNQSYMNISPGSFESYLWNDDSKKSSITVYEEGEYNVEVENIHGCKSSDTIYITIKDFLIPNAFSPNSDGLNDVFIPFTPEKGFSSYQFSIYNRVGAQIYKTNDIYEGWDGTFKGEKCPSGSYIWKAYFIYEGEGGKNSHFIRTGNVMLLR